jgi:hypothetical protein
MAALASEVQDLAADHRMDAVPELVVGLEHAFCEVREALDGELGGPSSRPGQPVR